jgi:hypothetical protein
MSMATGLFSVKPSLRSVWASMLWIAVLQREGVIPMAQRPGNPYQAEEAKWYLTNYGWSIVRSLIGN